MRFELRDIYRPAGRAGQSPYERSPVARRASFAGALLLALVSAGCSISFPILGLSSKAEDEIAMTVEGRWTDYHVSFSWMEDFEALHSDSKGRQVELHQCAQAAGDRGRQG